ncbi:unnamed protein product [Didymodactylos carnosus]|uniref:Mannosylglycerate hydrolase MGH1-like glycoside hydrolase domain-containing protein n=1 Tax=Didymodactylos carnosus TaxID=1234261 RepID=A0A815P6A4_9BILA|nr:unnamed protein product [Didymodactylos carnosus]CAF1444907.1 unnamed protein product [Didymodactylos carnosus]CAF4047084.1 unnamed protein product [Didymodactylos carnosus]CAF4319807.1 unnamed protein product [Didymodactylos carnosus]
MQNFPHDHARSRAYRWGEDGLLGIADRECRLCFSFALWNGKDGILKERLFGLSGPEGNHGEDVKEEYFYLDSTPTHSYMKGLYKYPQSAYPYSRLVDENGRRSKYEAEYELVDTGVFNENRYFDVFAEYAKNDPEDILIRLTIINRGPDTSTVHVLPTLFFRNTYSWECTHEGCHMKPKIILEDDMLRTKHDTLEPFLFDVGKDSDGNTPPILFTDNETNTKRLYGIDNLNPYVKDAFHSYIIDKNVNAVNPKQRGTKVAAHYILSLEPGESKAIHLRLCIAPKDGKLVKLDQKTFDNIFKQRIEEADLFYGSVIHSKLTNDEANVVRQAYAGLLWSKQFYHYVVEYWKKGDTGEAPPQRRLEGRNAQWDHLFSRDVISMPDKFEYPWFASWDLAFHMIPFSTIDENFAKSQLRLFVREWYLHPNGQMPAYEFNFSDVNPPVFAWAAWRVYKIANHKEKRDRSFLESVFLKLLLNFTWWVNKKDVDGKNLFGGGFLGLDNIGVFDRSEQLPQGGSIQQSDGTAWMGFYALTLLAISLDLAKDGEKVLEPFEDMASKFFEHFVQIVDAMNCMGGTGLWDAEDGFYYDQVKLSETGKEIRLKSRSLVGIIPLIAVSVLEGDKVDLLPGFRKRFEWFLKYKPDLKAHIGSRKSTKSEGHCSYLLSIPSREQLQQMLKVILDEDEFLSPYGLRSLSKFHEKHPYIFEAHGDKRSIKYEPGESESGMFGGNSNWRGPIWTPINYLVIEALERYHLYYGDDFQVECPTRSGNIKNLKEVASELSFRLSKLLLRDENGHRPCFGDDKRYQSDPHWRNLLLFHEYFHGDSGKGLGASHQTGWTALILRHIQDLGKEREEKHDSK